MNTDDDQDTNKFRRQQDRDDFVILERLKIKLEKLEDDLVDIKSKAKQYNECMQSIKSDIKNIKESQERFNPTLEGLDSIAKAGKVTRIAFGFVIGILGLVATVIAIIDYYRKW